MKEAFVSPLAFHRSVSDTISSLVLTACIACNCPPPPGDNVFGERQNVGSPSLEASGLPPG
uniref:hypothetical protein n=1 Tax=Solidesulfovibrio alcoholivorans TaxID=81406 RepID=UPI001B80D18A